MGKYQRRVVARCNTRVGCSDEFILEGQIGHLVTTRKLPDDPERLALVKWRGRFGHCSHPMSELEVLPSS